MARNKLPRQSVSFSEPAKAWLRAETARLGLPSVSELVRRCVDEARERQGRRRPETPPPPAPAAEPPA